MGLHILVVGGGIAGLATALALRRTGHKAQVFEESQLEYKDTVGPVVHIGPKSNDLLRSWEYDGAEARGVLVRDIGEFRNDGSVGDKAGETQRPGWMYYERSRLHKALVNAAVSPNGPGQPVEILLGSRVEAATETAQITLTDGRTVQGDVVVGADGFHSTIRKGVGKSDNITSGPAKVAVHFSVPTSRSASSSVVKRFHDQPERYEKWVCDNLQLNVYCVEPEHLLFDYTISIQGEASITGDWIKQEILAAFQPGHPEFMEFISTVKPSDMHFWTQPALPRSDYWTFKHLVLVGDAAHPFLPHELPGTSQALNDAAALAAELSPGVSVDEVEDRLCSWEGPRKDRVRAIQQSERGLSL